MLVGLYTFTDAMRPVTTELGELHSEKQILFTEKLSNIQLGHGQMDYSDSIFQGQ